MAWYKLDEEGGIEGLIKPLTPSVNYVARLNGTNQYWELSESILIPSNTDFDISLTAVRVGTSWGNLVSGTDFRISAAGQSGDYQLRVDSNGFSRVVEFGDNTWPSNETQRQVSIRRVGSSLDIYFDDEPSGNAIEYSSSLNILKMGRDNVIGGNDYLNGYIKDFSVTIDGVLTNSIQLTNITQGATQLATVGSVNATMINYDESAWEQV